MYINFRRFLVISSTLALPFKKQRSLFHRILVQPFILNEILNSSKFRVN